jgi:hypothetical protein
MVLRDYAVCITSSHSCLIYSLWLLVVSDYLAPIFGRSTYSKSFGSSPVSAFQSPWTLNWRLQVFSDDYSHCSGLKCALEFTNPSGVENAVQVPHHQLLLLHEKPKGPRTPWSIVDGQ